jgi:hypothetical protein
MHKPTRIALHIRLEALLEALTDNYGVKELLAALLAVCWGKAVKAMEDGQDPSEWTKLAVKLAAVIEI